MKWHSDNIYRITQKLWGNFFGVKVFRLDQYFGLIFSPNTQKVQKIAHIAKFGPVHWVKDGGVSPSRGPTLICSEKSNTLNPVTPLLMPNKIDTR